MKSICEKVSHKTRRSAEKELKRMEEGSGALFNAYKCARCGFWHVGSALKLVTPKLHKMFPKTKAEPISPEVLAYHEGWRDGVTHGLMMSKDVNIENQD